MQKELKSFKYCLDFWGGINVAVYLGVVLLLHPLNIATKNFFVNEIIIYIKLDICNINLKYILNKNIKKNKKYLKFKKILLQTVTIFIKFNTFTSTHNILHSHNHNIHHHF